MPAAAARRPPPETPASRGAQPKQQLATTKNQIKTNNNRKQIKTNNNKTKLENKPKLTTTNQNQN